MGLKLFKFRLEKLLKIKKQEEKQLEVDFIKLKNELYDLIDQIKSKTNEIKSSFEILKRESMEDIGSIERWRRYILLLKIQNDELKRLKVEKESEIEKKREELLSKMKERKSLEILKEKQYSAYLQEINKEEQNFIDEINTSRYGRGKSGSVLL